MGLFAGKRGIIMGVANEHSLAAGVAQFLKEQGAEIGLSHLPDKEGGPPKMLRRVMRVAEPLGIQFVHPCDVSQDDSIKNFFQIVKSSFGTIDFLVHSIAYAPLDDIKCATIDVSRGGFLNAMDISCYSFIACAREAASLMNQGGSIATMTYFGGERVVGGYNLMGVCKAALEASTKYLAWDLGPRGIRVNAVSAGPVKTLASSAVGAGEMLTMYESIAPLARNISGEEVGKATGFLLSDLASGTTGEVFHVDAGYHVMGSPGRAVLPSK